MDQNYSISEILSAVDQINEITKDKKKLDKNNFSKKDYTSVPKNTLKLIEEAEQNNK
jgi:thiamine biosynthesis lipoprotein ApbE